MQISNINLHVNVEIAHMLADGGSNAHRCACILYTLNDECFEQCIWTLDVLVLWRMVFGFNFTTELCICMREC